MTMIRTGTDGRSQSPQLQCAVLIPPDLRNPGASVELDEGGKPVPFLSDFLAEDIVRHVAKSFEYRVDIAYTSQLPPANFARDLERLLAADLMVFDLTGHDAQICFTAGLRYMTARPMICFIAEGMTAPSCLAHVRPIPYARKRLREGEAELTRRLKLISERHWTEGRPFFEVLSPADHKVRIGDFNLTRDVLADMEDRVHGDGGQSKRFSQSQGRGGRTSRYGYGG
jgi:hypothetical protein